MGTISDERRKFYLEYIRKIITKRPAATIKEIGECLIDNGLHLNKNTIDKYVKKIDGERTHRISHQLVKVVSTAQDGMNIRVAKLNEIIDNPMCEPMEKIAAMREWREETTKFIETLMNSGVLEKQLGKIKLEVGEISASDDMIDKGGRIMGATIQSDYKASNLSRAYRRGGSNNRTKTNK